MSTDVDLNGAGLASIKAGEQSMQDWIKRTLIETFYPDHVNLSDYKIVKSRRAYETYRVYDGQYHQEGNKTYMDDRITKITNEMVMVHGDDLDNAKQRFWQAIRAHAVVAQTKKLEGYEVDQGQLIIQDRIKIQTNEREDRCTMMWYGKIDKIPPGMELVKNE